MQKQQMIVTTNNIFKWLTNSNWNYGLTDSMVKHSSKAMQVKEVKQVTENFVWNAAHAPIELKAWARKIPDWKIVQDVIPQPHHRTGWIVYGQNRRNAGRAHTDSVWMHKTADRCFPGCKMKVTR